LISLIGLPGSGKSTVGRQLARRLSLPFIDSDAEIEKRLGCSIREYFEREGEAGFRDVEQVIITDLCTAHNVAATAAVLSTGGGTVLREANRTTLRANGHVVYLRSSADDVFKRLRHDRNRPLLQVGDPLQRLRDLYAARDPLYRETAHYVVETGRPSVAALVNMIVMQLELAGIHLAGNNVVGSSAVDTHLTNSAHRPKPL
jgi:shikimate kinase